MGCYLEGMMIVIIFSYFFYRSPLAVFLLSPLAYFYKEEKMRKLQRKRREELELEFKELLLSIRANLQAGYSIENCFWESRADMTRIFGEKAAIVEELDYMKSGINNGISFERLMYHFGKRNQGEIREFADIFLMASKMGGRWNEIIENTVDIITKKIELKEEVKLLIYEKELEHKIMCIVPFIIMTYMDLTSGGYFKLLYHNIGGVVIMTIAMAVYILAYKMGEKITQWEN